MTNKRKKGTQDVETRQRTNPFDPAQPARETFVGRVAELKELVYGLRDGKSYELTGPAGIGKTSLLLKIQQRIMEDPERLKMPAMPVPVYINCLRKHDRAGLLFADITNGLVQGLSQQCNHPCPLKVLKEVGTAVDGERLREALDVVFRWAFEAVGRNYRAILILDALHRVTNREVLKCLLGALNNETDRKTANVLFAGRRLLVNIVPEAVSDIRMLFTGHRELGPLDEEETEVLAAVAVKHRWPFEKSSAQVAWDLTGGNPYRLQYYLHQALEQHGEITPKSLLNLKAKNIDKLIDAHLAEATDAPSHLVDPIADTKEGEGRVAGTDLAQTPSQVSPRSTGGKPELVNEVIGLLSAMGSITIDDHKVVGNYVRFDSDVADMLRREAKRIQDASRSGVGGYHNFLIWGSSGEGKTYFAKETASAAGIDSERINLASTEDVPDEATFKSRLAAVKAKDGPYLCIIDECDKRPTDLWVCTALFDSLSFEPNSTGSKAQQAGGRFCNWTRSILKNTGPAGNKVFILIGSTGDSVALFWAGVRELRGGKDLETRIPPPYIIIPETTMRDRLVVVLSQIRRYAGEKSRRVERVEKLALAYVLLSDKGSKPRGIEKMVIQAVERLRDVDTELQYGHFFGFDEADEGAFVREYGQVYDALHSHSLRLK